MNSKSSLLLLALSALTLSASVFASPNTFKLNSDLSTLSFATIKLQYVVEPAKITQLSGNIDKDGKVTIDVPIAKLDTGVGIRNERLNKLFFNSDVFPKATVTAQLPSSVLSSDVLVEQMTLPASVTLFGKEQALSFTVNILKSGNNIAVSTVSPTMINAAQFGIPSENLSALAQTVGGIPIANSVPVSFSLILSK